tara:strand:- start:34 stop:246 length:213 start_codon:yes stop_codon:yes gene_type:complete
MDINKIISIVRNLKEEGMVGPTNNVGSGHIAGTVEAGDDPPVRKKKRRSTPVGRYGSRKMWIDNLKNGRA